MSAPLDEILAEELGPALAPVVQALGDYICRRMQHGANDEWVDQRHSDRLGPRRHCAAVRRIQAEDPERAIIDGERFLLRRDALAEELKRLGKPTVAKPPPPPDPDNAAVERIKRRLEK